MEKSVERVIHYYDPARREVLCGLAEQTNSTKHGSQVTCATCRERMGRAASRPVEADPAPAGA